MNTSLKKHLSFSLLLVLVLACTKHINLVTEVEFEIIGQHANEGFVNQGLETNFTVVAEAELDNYQYGISYTPLQGKGYFEDASGKRWDTGKELMLASDSNLTTSLLYIGTEPGKHRIQVTASDNFGFSEKIELFYNLSNAPAIWEATTKVTQIELGMSADIQLVFEPTEASTELTYEARYAFAKGAGTLVPTQENAPSIGTNYKTISPGSYKLNFTPSKLGSQSLIYTLNPT